ncbi:MAG: hypothetical protein DMD29_10440 [Gemmatimonadetes bacterium]|nr:MAG: hypothetical protein DMD29_10440 [Gemmatimonadota bacterium]
MEAIMRLATFVGIAAVVALAACKNSYGTGGGGGCSPTATKVCALDNVFNPLTLTVTHGTTVTWQNGGGNTHTVTNDPGSADTYDMTVSAGGTVTHTFSNAGTYTYHCTFHGAPGTLMHGTITVN